VPGYRELADLNRLVKVADQCLEMSFELVHVPCARAVSSDRCSDSQSSSHLRDVRRRAGALSTTTPKGLPGFCLASWKSSCVNCAGDSCQTGWHRAIHADTLLQPAAKTHGVEILPVAGAETLGRNASVERMTLRILRSTSSTSVCR